VTPLPRDERRFEDNAVEAGASYEYWVTAADSAGNESVKSATVTLLMRDYLPPRHVRNTQALRNDAGEVALRWEPVPAQDLAGYRIESASAITDRFAPVQETLVTDTFWIDAGNGEARCYRIFAVDTSGNESRPGQPVCAQAALNQ
jgi:fibronectin type 3 domain-containing protein